MEVNRRFLLPRPTGGDRFKISSILLLIAVVSTFHFTTSTDLRYLHEIYQRIYYIPILLAAFWYGPVIGVSAAILVSLIYTVHIQSDWHHLPVYAFNQYAEIILYHAVALVIGILSQKERLQRQRLEETSRELSEAYQKLQDTFEQLRRADRLAALGELSAGIAHEIRNPLGSIKGSMEILENEIAEDNPKREFVEIIKEETVRLNNIVSQFLRFARPPEPSREATSLNDLIESTIPLIEQEAEKNGIEIRTDLDYSLSSSTLDPEQIRQVLLNILLNSIQAMPEGGQLTIRSIQDLNQAHTVVEVADTGPGASKEVLDHIFDPFFSTKPQGTGLGLSVSYQLVEQHGGTLSAHPNAEGGLTLRIELP